MTRHFILDDEGNIQPADVMTWARWFEKKDVRIVKQTQIGPVFVSTVFLGLDHNFSGKGPPLIWETCVFMSPDGDGRIRRYAEREEAWRGHIEVCAEIECLLATCGVQ